MRKKQAGITAAIGENTAAREALAEQLRDKDWNGFTPDDDNAKANPKQTDSTLLTGLATRFGIPDDPHERNIWMAGYLAAVSIVMAHQQARRTS